MARVILSEPVLEIHGAFTRKGIINRQKKYRDESGRVIFEGCQEAYVIKHPRDWKLNPAKGAELAHHNRWREACLRTTQILQSAQPEGLTKQQLFHRQLTPGKKHKPCTPTTTNASLPSFRAAPIVLRRTLPLGEPNPIRKRP